jgi:hypothetical protein
MQFDELCAKGEVGAEVRSLFQAVLVLFEIIMAVFMEKQTKKTTERAGCTSAHAFRSPGTSGRIAFLPTVEQLAELFGRLLTRGVHNCLQTAADLSRCLGV